MADSGFVNSYRAVHPDPVAKPGLTWTPGYPHPFVRPQETHDRIDYIYSIGAKAVASQVVGEVGGPDVEISVEPWPADHRALLTTFEVEPAPTPDLITVEPRVGEAGRSVRGAGGDAKAGKTGRYRFYPAGAAEAAVDHLGAGGSGGSSGGAVRHREAGARGVSRRRQRREWQAACRRHLLGD